MLTAIAEDAAARQLAGDAEERWLPKESTMAYAVFKDADRISRPFQTEGDAWDCANDAGLVENVLSSGGSVQVLDSRRKIEPCDGELVMPANLA
jgi:hypothetical protein